MPVILVALKSDSTKSLNLESCNRYIAHLASWLLEEESYPFVLGGLKFLRHFLYPTFCLHEGPAWHLSLP
jgi:hypothetical protein